MPNIYQRPKVTLADGRTAYRYQKIVTGRGIKVGDLQPPFYVSRFKKWVKLDAQTYAEAAEESALKFAEFEAENKGVAIEGEVENHMLLTAAVAKYLDLKRSKAPKTLTAYRLGLNQFAEILAALGVRFLDGITVDVLREYKNEMERQGYATKTLDTRMNYAAQLMKKFEVKPRIPVDEMPEVEVEPPEPFSDEAVKALLTACDDEERVVFRFFLGTGAREAEVTFAAWSDVDLLTGKFTVRKKPDVGFFPKSHESRTVPLPDSVVAELKARHKKADGGRWIFPSKHGKPDGHFLRKLKGVAHRAGLNCGHCHSKWNGKPVSCKHEAVCEKFYLHRLRKTAATRWSHNGISVRTIQAWLGHKSLETTMLYLGVQDSNKLQTNVNAAFGD
jgi:integrase